MAARRIGRDRDNESKWRAESRAKRRQKVLNTLGGQCVKCGFADWRALQIDHIYGGGTKARRARNNHNRGAYYQQVMESVKQGLDTYQCLCANCNWIKRYENNETSKG